MHVFRLLTKLFGWLFVILLVILIGVGSLIYYARKIEPQNIKINSIKVEIKNLPGDLEGLRIVQISDLHGKKFDDIDLAEKINTLKPDILVITGDVLDSRFTDYSYITEVLGPIEAKLGKFFVYGNNEYTRKLSRADMDKAYETAGITVLSNQSYPVLNNEEPLWLVGVEDPNTGHSRLEKAILKSSKGPRIVLAHSPEIISEAAQRNIELVLTGHTHGGQLRIPGLARHPELKSAVNRLFLKANALANRILRLIRKQQDVLDNSYLSQIEILQNNKGNVKLPKVDLLYSFNMKQGFEQYNSGLYKVGNTIMYVNRGLGETWVPFRLFSPPEITEIELVQSRR